MRVVPITIVIAFALASSSREASGQEFSFRGQRPGAPVSALTDSVTCARGLVARERRCETYVDIGEQGVPVTYAYLDGKLYHILFTYRSDGFARMTDIFKAKYGAPTSSRSEPYATRGGAHTRNRILLWKFRDGELEMREYGSTISEGTGSFATYAGLRAFTALRQESARAAAKQDLDGPHRQRP